MNQNSRGVLLNFRLKRLKVRPSKFKTTAQPTQKPQITTDLTYTVTVFENRHIKVMNENSKDECEITHPLKKKMRCCVDIVACRAQLQKCSKQ